MCKCCGLGKTIIHFPKANTNIRTSSSFWVQVYPYRSSMPPFSSLGACFCMNHAWREEEG